MTHRQPTLLQIDSSVTGSASVTRELTAVIADAIAARTPGVHRIERDLAADPVPHLDATALSVLRPSADGGPPSAESRAAAALNEELVREFLDADIVVIGAPMYNFSIPTQLKAWIDRVAQAGRTFRYTATGPEGLAGGKQVVIVSGRGGKYAGEAFEGAMDHQEAYLRAVFGFFGITDVTVVRAEGVAMGAEARAAAVEAALGRGDTVSAQVAARVAIDRARREAEAATA
jgi:FMN-dependent NADH-azoreductase